MRGEDLREFSRDSSYNSGSVSSLRFVSIISKGIDMTTWPELPDWGVYFHWPEEGTDWIHPEDVELAQAWIPSNRVFFRHGFDGTYYHLKYGEKSLRVKPTLWTRIACEDFHIGDAIEVRNYNMERDPIVATIIEKRFEVETQRIGYNLVHRELPVDRVYHAEELKSLHPRVVLRESDGNLVLKPNDTNRSTEDK